MTMIKGRTDTSEPTQGVSLKYCQVRVYSDDFWVSPDEREEQEFGQRLARAGVTDWIQQQRGQVLIPCVGSSKAEGSRGAR